MGQGIQKRSDSKAADRDRVRVGDETIRSQVVISAGFVDSPVVEHPDYFCAFSSIAYANQEIYLALVLAGSVGLAQALPISFDNPAMA